MFAVYLAPLSQMRTDVYEIQYTLTMLQGHPLTVIGNEGWP